MYNYDVLDNLVRNGLCYAYIDQNHATISLDTDTSSWYVNGSNFHRVELTQHAISFPLGENLFNFLSLSDDVLSTVQKKVQKHHGSWNGEHKNDEEQNFFSDLDCIYIYILYYSFHRNILDGSLKHSLPNIRKEFEFALNFCCNTDFIPELKNLSALDRYYIYSELYNDNNNTNIKNLERNTYIFLESAHAIDSLNQMARMDGSNEEYHSIAAEKPITDKPTFSTKAIAELQKAKISAVTRYQYTHLQSYLMEELYALIQSNVQIKKCRRCGKYFITKGHYATEYCDRINAGEKFSCKKLAAIETRKNKVNGNPILQEYQKAYKRLYARVASKNMTPEDFQKWSDETSRKRDQLVQNYGSFPPGDVLADFKKYLGNR